MTIALCAIELGAELGRPSGGGSWRENIVLGLTFGGVPELIDVTATEAAVVGDVYGNVDRGTPVVKSDGGRFAENVVEGAVINFTLPVARGAAEVGGYVGIGVDCEGAFEV